MYLLKVSDLHKIAIHEKGNKEGRPVIFLHGGPGGSIGEASFSFFDLDKYHVIAFDQRGTGKSEPFLERKDNSVFDSVEDIETIRRHYGFDKIILFGGSYGTTLALCYAIKYPQNVEHIVLRGVFLGRDEDVKWLYQEGASYIYPIEHEKFKNHLDASDQGDIIAGYHKIFTTGTTDEVRTAAKIWSDWENSITCMEPRKISPEITDGDLTIAIFECNYFFNHMFWDDDNYILNNADKIKDLPIDIVHGRFDVDCRVCGAYDLYKKLDNAKLHIIQNGSHNPYEKDVFEKLKSIMENL